MYNKSLPMYPSQSSTNSQHYGNRISLLLHFSSLMLNYFNVNSGYLIPFVNSSECLPNRWRLIFLEDVTPMPLSHLKKINSLLSRNGQSESQFPWLFDKCHCTIRFKKSRPKENSHFTFGWYIPSYFFLVTYLLKKLG